jgi:DNA-binding transcriptional regulator/RsmH inhibitor MraZ
LKGKQPKWLVEVIAGRIEEERRVVLPKAHRDLLGESFYITALPGWNFVGLFPEKAWAEAIRPLLGLSLADKELIRVKALVGAHSALVEATTAGRFTIPQSLRSFFRDVDVMFVGALDAVFIFNPSDWAKLAREGFRNVKGKRRTSGIASTLVRGKQRE